MREGATMPARARLCIAFACALATTAALALTPPWAAASLALLPPHTVLPGACSLDLSAGDSHCNLMLLGDLNDLPLASSAPLGGYGPSDLQHAYLLPSFTAGGGQTVAIVDAYDDTSAEADMGVYRSTYGLPACTTANGCFRKVNQTGVQGLPATTTRAGATRSASTSTWSRRPARRATSCWSRRARTPREPVHRREHGGALGATDDLQQLRRQRDYDDLTNDSLLPPPGHRDHRVRRRQRLWRRIPRPHRRT